MKGDAQQMPPYFSVIIPNWNGRHHLQECLDSVTAQSRCDFELILVDNGSSDGSVEFVRERYPAAIIVELRENAGFAGGVNAGIRAARGRYLVLLNNDTAVEPDWLERLAAAIRENPHVSIFASKLLNYFRRELIDSAGDGFDLASGPYKIGEHQLSESYRERRLIFGACGGGGCYKRELFNDIGLFDEDFFAYFEDVDLSFRANWAGYRCLSVPDAIIYHKVAATAGATGANRDRFDIMRRRNYMFLVIKNYPLVFLVQYLPRILAIHSMKFLRNIFRCRFRVAFMIQWEIATGVPLMLKKHRNIMRGRRISCAEMRSRCIPVDGGGTEQ